MTNPSMAHTKLHFLHLYDLRTKKNPTEMKFFGYKNQCFKDFKYLGERYKLCIEFGRDGSSGRASNWT